MNNLSELTVVIVTYKTNLDILKNCLNSINNKTRTLIIENSNFFDNKQEIEEQFSNVEIICSGSNLGYGAGNNFGGALNFANANVENVTVILTTGNDVQFYKQGAAFATHADFSNGTVVASGTYLVA